MATVVRCTSEVAIFIGMYNEVICTIAICIYVHYVKSGVLGSVFYVTLCLFRYFLSCCYVRVLNLERILNIRNHYTRRNES